MQSLVALFDFDPQNTEKAFKPLAFCLNNMQQVADLENWLTKNKTVVYTNNLHHQLKELVKTQNPSTKPTEEFYQTQIDLILTGKHAWLYGTWFYYPWLNTLVQTLPKNEFIAVRTNRNKLKITQAEQAILAQKTIGVIGLSVGQSVAITLIMERICGKIKLADFDELELSNLNRLRAGLQNLGQSKAIIAARQIAEIDPYIEVEIFDKGINDQNMSQFFDELHLLVEVCDELSIKIKSRVKAKSLAIPVVMDTNDRGMIDVERFDLDNDLPILHGLIDAKDIENINTLTPEERMQCILKIVSYENTSARLKQSMPQIGKTINTWPQLASSVMIGAGSCADTCRRILLNQTTTSGRFYIDTQQIIP